MTQITLTVVSMNGQAADGTLSAQFDETGGLIGRADTNQLVLPDPDRSISRVHAQVVFRNGRYAVVDRGSNAILVNGEPVGRDREALLAEGDRVQIGGYLLSVRLQDGQSRSLAADPFADLLAAPAPAPRAGARGLVDPLLAPPPPAPAAPAGRAAPAASALDEDWNPFAPGATPMHAPAAAARPAGGNALGLELGAAAGPALIPDMAGGGTDSLDALFGLGAPSMGKLDPFAETPLAQPAAMPNMAAHADPLKSLQSAAPATGQAESDQLSDLNRPFQAPVRPAPPPTPAFDPPAAADPILGPRAAFSWDEAPGEGHTVIRPSGAARAPAAASTSAPASTPTPTPTPVPAPAPVVAATPDPFAGMPFAEPTAAAAALPAAAPAAAPDALLQALRDGLGMPELKIDALTPEAMRGIGVLLREAIGGTVDLLVARAALKRELRAESTVIRVGANNPLKFSPSAEVAIQHLLAPPARGFMAAEPAMRDAYADLRAHQFGMVAGMRAALEGVLQRFEPTDLEGRLSKQSVLQSLLPGSRKARLWEVFVEHYGQIRNDAAEDFHTLFGKAFLKAYEEQLDRIEQEQGR